MDFTLMLRCPECHAKKGEPCTATAPDGRVATFEDGLYHSARHDATERALIAMAERHAELKAR